MERFMELLSRCKLLFMMHSGNTTTRNWGEDEKIYESHLGILYRSYPQ